MIDESAACRSDGVGAPGSAFDHPDWIFKPKLDGFRAVAYVEGGSWQLVSRNGNVFKTFTSLAQAISQDLSGRTVVLDGEIVRPGADGRPQFCELMRRRGYSAFRVRPRLARLERSAEGPLWERKALLQDLIPQWGRAVYYVDHMRSDGSVPA